MVQIKIKGLNKAYHVCAAFDDVHAFYIQLEERLKACNKTNNMYFEAFFHIPQISSHNLVKLFEVCERCHTTILGVNVVERRHMPIFIEEGLRGGEHYTFEKPVILFGSICKQAFVTSRSSIYVIGDVYGSIDFLYEDCMLCCSSIDGNVRICDTPFQNVTSLAPVKVYYRDRHLIKDAYKEERMWERQ